MDVGMIDGQEQYTPLHFYFLLYIVHLFLFILI